MESLQEVMPFLEKEMHRLAPDLERLTKLSTEITTLKESQTKIEFSQKQDAQTLEALLKGIEENHTVLKANLASLQTRVQALQT